MVSPRRLACASLVLLCCWAASAAFAQGFRGTVADSWLEEASPTTNYGTDDELRVRTVSADDFRSIFQYDLSAVAPNANVTEAEAWFWIRQADTSGAVVNIYRITESWDEANVDWSNAAGDYDPSTIHGTFVPDKAGWVRIDIIDLVQSWICGEFDDFGLMLVSTSASGESQYTSREYSNQGQRPRLRLTTSGVNPCADTVDHFVVVHDSFGIYCLAETITIRAEDASNNPVTSYAEVTTLDTQTGRGSWSLVAGAGTLIDATPDDGLATYQWPGTESEATFALSYSEGAVPLDVDVYQSDDASLRDDDSEGPLAFSANGFTLTAAPLSNPPPAIIVPFDATQTAAVPFPVYLTAYGQTANDPLCGVIESYTGSRDLKFWSQYVDPVSGSLAFEIDGVTIPAFEAGAANQSVLFVNGQATVTGNYDDVGLKQVLVKDDTTVNPELPGGIRGGTANFVVVPDTFVLSDIRSGDGTIVNPQAIDANDPIFIAAGAEFRATVEALNADGNPTPNYGRETVPETVRLDVQLFDPMGGASPPVSAATGFGAFAGGSATGFDFIWPEVGIIELIPAVGDGFYLTAGDVVGDLSERVGRFVPDRFAVALIDPMFGTACDDGASGFTYTGQNFNYVAVPEITATAQAVGGSTTLNYEGAYFKFFDGMLPVRTYTSSQPLDLTGVPGPAVDPDVTELGAGLARFVFSGGVTGFSFVKGAPAAPFDADIVLTFSVIDADLVAAATNPVTFNGVGSGILFDVDEEIRYGRMRFINAVGSEIVDLPLPLRAEYYAGAAVGFVPNSNDSCSTNVSLTLSGYTENLDPNETCVLDTGMPGASGAGCPAAAPPAQQFAEPPANGDFNLILAAPGLTNNGSVLVGASVPSWLRFDWNAAAPGDEDPVGQATFGLFGGNARQIYLREIY